MHWQVALAGDARTATHFAVENEQQALETATSLLSAIAALGPTARARDLSPSAKLPISPLVGEMAGRPEGGTDDTTLLGIFPLADASIALGIALPFGHADAADLTAFAHQAASLGVADIRLAVKRTILSLCPTAEAAGTLQQAAQSLGFVVTSTDPRTAISACPGAPACASGHIAARELAAAVAPDLAGLLGTTFHLHVSGCAKGCAHPGKAALTLVGSEIGAGIVVDGTARDRPLAYTAPEGARDGLARLAQALRADGSPSRICDAEKLAEAFGKE